MSRVRSEVDLRWAAIQLQLSLSGMLRFELQLSATYTYLAAAHAQSHQEHGSDGSNRKRTLHRVLRHAENQNGLLHRRASKNHRPQHSHVHPVNPIIPSILINNLEPSLSDLFLPFMMTSHVSDAEFLARRLIGTCIRRHTSYWISH